MREYMEKKIQETVEKINNGIHLSEIYTSLLTDLQHNEAYHVITQAQLLIARKKAESM